MIIPMNSLAPSSSFFVVLFVEKPIRLSKPQLDDGEFAPRIKEEDQISCAQPEDESSPKHYLNSFETVNGHVAKCIPRSESATARP